MPHQRPRHATQGSSSGLISSVFSFVSREIESFVSSATGKEPEEDEDIEYSDQPEASTSQVKLTSRTSDKTKNGCRRKETRPVGRKTARQDGGADVLKHRLRMGARQRSPNSSDDDGDRRHKKQHNTTNLHMLHSVRKQPTQQSDDDEEELSGSEHSRSVSPKPLPTRSRRQRPSISMPGSFISRSSSLEPSPEPDLERVRVVRFASDTVKTPTDRKQVTPRSARYSKETEVDSPDSRDSHLRSGRRVHEPQSVESSPEVINLCRSSSPTSSPSVSKRSKVLNATRRFAKEDQANVSLMLPRSPSYSQINQTASDYKGKARERQLDSEDKLEENQKLGRSKDHISSGDLSCETVVKGKERELLTAKQKERESHNSEDDDERRHDKERIKALEEELKKLREELAKRPTATQPYFIPPAPPPPPLPPLGISVRSQANQPVSLFANTRASLRHTATPVEKPINPAAYGGASKLKGQPTINVGADKMAAFLTEMKTHRLRKVGSTNGSFFVPALPSRPAERVREVGDIGNKSEVLSRPRADDIGNRSEALLRPNRNFGAPPPKQKNIPDKDGALLVETQAQAQAGIKRKRAEDLTGDSQSSLPLKRRVLASSANLSAGSSTANNSSFFSTSRSGQSNSSSAFAQSHPPPASDTSSNSRMLSAGRAEADMTTPSLCSDNELDSAGFEERLPPTPPLSASVRSRSKSISVDAIRKPQLRDTSQSTVRTEQHAKDMDMEGYAETLKQARSQPAPMENKAAPGTSAFMRRSQASKLLESPRRPRPPARPKPNKEALRLEVEDEEEEEEEEGDPLSLSYSTTAPAEFSTQIESAEGRRGRATERTDSPPVRLPARPPLGTFKLAKQKEPQLSRLPVRPKAIAFKKASQSSTRESSRASSTASMSRRKDTLESEIRRAEQSFEAEIFDDDVQLESGVLTAAGMRSRKQGFISHGGAGGRSVLMGSGYVEGLDDESEFEDEQPRPPRRRARRMSIR